ncbi:DUF6755 family protein [Solitalea canadensis]|uniref:DUF6755 family protein n=1 Tax=Solitalea canadensis TaxID=995 RepID=UPI0009DA0460|nr:DUF6755 family protein [Solitalea canadensis]
MSNFRDAQSQAHPNKRSTISSAIMMILILNVTLQIWLLYTGLNNALSNNTDIGFPMLIASLVIFLINCGLLYYLPGRKKR